MLGLLGCPGTDAPDSVCGQEDTGQQIGIIDPSCQCLDSVLEIGTGSVAFESLGDSVEMVHGPQGSWHLPGALRITNSRNIVRIAAQVHDLETGIAVTDELNHHVQLVAEDTCVGSYPNMFLYLDTKELDPDTTTAWALSCRDVVVTMCITDTGGRDACTETTLFVEPDPTDVQDGEAAACP
ncbi:MAG: hypothetical protein GY913_16875 [Proteobacteria bacterium]|nr:hypothetical protein [Pseudomonadota bacterium]MCP4918578.1 hypothetical protein [Pseudomonadota bacterium]